MHPHSKSKRAARPRLTRHIPKELVFQVPDGLDFSQFPPELHDGIAYTTSLIIKKQCERLGDDFGEARIKTMYARNVVGQRVWPLVRDVLEKRGVIHCDHRYEVGKKCFCYWLLAPFNLQDTRPYFCTRPSMRRAMAKAHAEYERSLTPTDRWLRDNALTLDFDMVSARQVINTMIPPDKPRRKNQPPLETGEYRCLIRSIASQCWQISKDPMPLIPDDYGRRHTPFTRLPKALRHCITFDGEPLVEVDIKNSQPLFFGMVVLQLIAKNAGKDVRSWRTPISTPQTPSERPLFTTKNAPREDSTRQPEDPNLANIISGITERLRPPRETTQPPSKSQTEGLLLHTMLNVPEGVTQYRFAEWVPGDLIRYITLCEMGEFYESLMGPDDDRNAFKTHFFRDVLYGQDKHPSRLRDRFQREYPTLYTALQTLKAGRADDAYCRAARRMQQVESRLVIGAVCGRLRMEFPDMPLLTIHDALATTERFVPVVKQALLDEFAKQCVQPSLSEKRWLPPELAVHA